MKLIYYQIFFLILFGCNLTVWGQESTNRRIDSLVTAADSIKLVNKDEKLKKANEALKLSLDQGYFAGSAAAHRIIGKVYFSTADYAASKNNHLKSLSYFSLVKDSAGIADSYSNLGNVYAKTGDTDSSVICHQISAKLFNKLGMKKQAGVEIISLGLRYLSLGDYSNSEKNFLDVLNLRLELKDTASISTVYNNLGALYWRWGKLKKAMDMYEESISLRQKIKNVKGQVLPILNIGLIFIDLMDLTYAEKYLMDGLKLANELEFDLGISTAKLYLADLYFRKKEYEKSKLYANEALTIYVKINAQMGKIRANVYLAKNMIQLGELFEAERILKKTLDEMNNFVTSQVGPEVYFTLAQLEYKRGNYSRAQDFINQSLNGPETIINIHKEMVLLAAKIYQKVGRPDKALKFFDEYQMLTDSIHSTQVVDVVSNWRVKLQTTQNENEILKLKEFSLQQDAEISSQVNIRNIFIISSISALIIALLLARLYRQKERLIHEIEIQKEQLTHSNESKLKLFSIIAHDLRNPFMTLLGLSDELVSVGSSMDQDNIRIASEAIHKSALKLSKLTQNLLDWARINAAGIEVNPVKSNISEIVSDISEEFTEQANQKKIEIKQAIEKELFCICDKNMIFTILRNMINNAIKFSNPGGIINISAKKNNDGLIIEVQDFGIGISEEASLKIFDSNQFYSTNGTLSEKGSGLGLKISQEFAKMNNGQISLSSDSNNGTIFRLMLPIESE